MTNIKPIQRNLQLEVLSPTELEEIKSGTLRVLNEVGVIFPSERALKIFADYGAKVNFETSIVRMKPDLVTGAMDKAPRSYTLSGRADGTDLHLGDSHTYFATDGCGVETIDFETGEQRLSCKDDVAKMARVADFTIGLGMLKASTLLIPEQIIFDDEIYHSHRILTQGLNINLNGLTLDIIKQVGSGGHFLAQKHTRSNLRERWIPRLTNPQSVNGDGPADIQMRARAELDRILDEHQPEPLDKTVQNELVSILEAAEREFIH